MARPRRNTRRLIPVLLLAAVAFAGGLAVGGGYEPAERRLAADFAAAWEREDYAAMHGMLTPSVRREVPLRRFAELYRRDAGLATVDTLRSGAPRPPGEDRIAVPFTAQTRIFGPVRADLVLPLAIGPEGNPVVDWTPRLTFPGVRAGERLRRTTRMPPRAALLAADGTPIAEGEERLSELDPVAAEIGGRVGPAPADQAAELDARGVPEDTPVGLTGLEREFEVRLAGTPGGELLAGQRVLATTEPERGRDVETTIDPEVQLAAVTALAGRLGGVAAVRPDSGEVVALAGIAFSAPQPPGSVFKIITLAGALDAGTVKRSAEFPVETAATLEGVQLQNANGEYCGGSLINSFAQSCNSVFAPMGAELGAERLVAAAERFGFNAPPVLAGEERSTLPAASEIGDDLAVGSTAIGQGKVLATPLRFALVAAAIAENGRMVEPTLLQGDETGATQVTKKGTARFVRRGMKAVVREGTGVGAAIDGVTVAGKTGTAELRSTVSQDPVPVEGASDTTDTNAWFTAFAPASDAEIAVAVMLVGQGAGGATAAPVAKTVIEATL